MAALGSDSEDDMEDIAVHKSEFRRSSSEEREIEKKEEEMRDFPAVKGGDDELVSMKASLLSNMKGTSPSEVNIYNSPLFKQFLLLNHN